MKNRTLFSDSTLKRHLIYTSATQLFSLQRILRVHLLIDTNIKVQWLRPQDGEVAFGSKDLREEGFEQRLLTFEC